MVVERYAKNSRFWRKVKTIYKKLLWQLKGMQKTPDFDAELRPYTLYKEFLWQSKGMQKTPDFDAN